MPLTKLTRVVVGVGVFGATAAIAYRYLFCPYADHWGATPDEIYGRFPGDELIPQPKRQYTHAITIHALASAIWPWLVQLGQGRGGFYSYDWLENLAGLKMQSADHILPQFQNLKIGDMVRMTPEGGGEVIILEPERDLVLYADADTLAGRPIRTVGVLGDEPAASISVWGYHLRPLDSRSTRLITHTRGDWNANLGNTITNGILLRIVDFIMSQKMLRGIKERAEAGGAS